MLCTVITEEIWFYLCYEGSVQVIDKKGQLGPIGISVSRRFLISRRQANVLRLFCKAFTCSNEIRLNFVLFLTAIAAGG